MLNISFSTDIPQNLKDAIRVFPETAGDKEQEHFPRKFIY